MSPVATRTRASPTRSARKAAASSLRPAPRRAAAPSTGPRFRSSRSPTLPTWCTAPSPARAIPGITATPRPPVPSSTAPASRRISASLTDLSAARSNCIRAIREVIEKYDPPAVFVYQTCVSGHDRRRYRSGVQAGAREIRQAGGSRSIHPASSAARTSATNWRARRCWITSSAPRSRKPPLLTTSTSSANTTWRANCGRSSRCWTSSASACWPASRAMRAITTSPARTAPRRR